MHVLRYSQKLNSEEGRNVQFPDYRLARNYSLVEKRMAFSIKRGGPRSEIRSKLANGIAAIERTSPMICTQTSDPGSQCTGFDVHQCRRGL
jgi:hypothetical protein